MSWTDLLCLGLKLCARLCAMKMLASGRQCLRCAELLDDLQACITLCHCKSAEPPVVQDVALQEVSSMRWGQFKSTLADAVVAHLQPIQERYHAVIQDTAYLDQVRLPPVICTPAHRGWHLSMSCSAAIITWQSIHCLCRCLQRVLQKLRRAPTGPLIIAGRQWALFPASRCNSIPLCTAIALLHEHIASLMLHRTAAVSTDTTTQNTEDIHLS